MPSYFQIKSILHIPLYDEKVASSKYYAKHAKTVDAVVLDLEDGVLAEKKPMARNILKQAFSFYKEANPNLFVRINKDEYQKDLEFINGLSDLKGIFVPKVSSVQDLKNIINRANASFDIIPIAECAEAIVHAEDIFLSDETIKNKIKAFIFGPEDLSAQMGIFPNDQNMLYAAQKLKLVATVLQVPLWGTLCSFINFKDQTQFRKSLELSKSIGFNACFAIHPDQIAIIKDVHDSTEELLQEAAVIEKKLLTRGVSSHGDIMVGPPTLKRIEFLKKMAK